MGQEGKFSQKSPTIPTTPGGADLQRVRARILTVLSEDDVPRSGLPTRDIRSRIRGADKGLLLDALWSLQEDGILEAVPISYRNRPGLRWRLTDPLRPSLGELPPPA